MAMDAPKSSKSQHLASSPVSEFIIGGNLPVRRLGFGAMRISSARNGDGARDRTEAHRLIRTVIDRGTNFIDTANIYGYGESEEIIAEALYPYPSDLVITTKAGFHPSKILRGHITLPPSGHPDQIKIECDRSLQRLRVDKIDLYQIHTPDPSIPYDETIGAFVELQDKGKIQHIGISNVTHEQLRFAQTLCRVVSVQNRYNAGDRTSDAVVETCRAEGIAFIPWAPILVGANGVNRVLIDIAQNRGVSIQQISLQWLLQRSKNVLPIPGTSNVIHAEHNINAAWLTLDDSDIARIDEAAGA